MTFNIFSKFFTKISRDTYTVRILCFAVIYAVFFLSAFSLPPHFYASSSKLSTGSWAKIEVSETGIHLISNSVLKSLGFADPSKVNVYGYGGGILPESLSTDMTDDIPKIPCIRTSAGILFYAKGPVEYSLEKNPTSAGMEYSHTMNPYSDSSFYFLSDSDPEKISPGYADIYESSSSTPVKTFTQRLLHEKDMASPGRSGRMLLGEDFRSKTTQTFPFQLPGNTGDARIRIHFGAKVSNGSSAFVVSANGNLLQATTADRIPAISSSETFLATTLTSKTVPNPGEKLSLQLQYSYSGAIFSANLDYIEVEYPRQLVLTGNELCFNLNLSVPSIVNIELNGKETTIWDVTDPLSPRTVNYDFDGSTASFVSPKGPREFVAFNPSEISRLAKAAGRVENQDIHSSTPPDMVIIAPELFLPAAKKLADLHIDSQGLSVIVVTPSQVYNEFSSGRQDVTAFRKMLKMWFDRNPRSVRYCILMGRPSYDCKHATPALRLSGYPRIPIWQSPEGLSYTTSYSTDDYIGMLDDDITPLNINTAKIHTAIGRFPVKSLSEANSAVAKLESYIASSDRGFWRNTTLVIADDQDKGEHILQAEDVISGMKGSSRGDATLFDRIYLDSYPLEMTATGASYPIANSRLKTRLNEGISMIYYIGHASTREWTHEGLLTWSDINSLTNTRYPFVFASTCDFLQWDSDDISGGETMWLRPDSGIIGMLCPSRKVFISLNGIFNHNISSVITSNENSPRVGDIMIAGKNATLPDNNRLRYALLGDPALSLPYMSHQISVDSIAGKEVCQPDSLPVVKAGERFSVSGSILSNDGVTDSSFNGIMEIRLYDSEKVVETFGNGNDGEIMTYNDRQSRLFSAFAKVDHGRWHSEIIVPPEIEHNYSPALISLYACSDSGMEANGKSESLYLYGSSISGTDNEGPVMSEIYLDSPDFRNGDFTGPSPTFHAVLSDMSGINTSDTGIGHSMILTLDGTPLEPSPALFFSPDIGSPNGGKLNYPLLGVSPGEHTLTLIAWDNANNYSSSSISFKVKAGWIPEITSVDTDVNSTSSSVTFTIDTDSFDASLTCLFEIFDLSGKIIWSENMKPTSSSGMNFTWDLRDFGGGRMSRGIYPYRATVMTPSGARIAKGGKIAISLP